MPTQTTAAAARVSTGTVHYYFATKDEVLAAEQLGVCAESPGGRP